MKTDPIEKNIVPWISGAAWTSSMRVLRGVYTIRELGERERDIYIYFYERGTYIPV